MAARTSNVVRLSGNYQVSVPKRIREALGLKLGDFLETSIEDGAVVFRPKTLADREVVVAYEEATEDERAGRLSGPFDTVEALAAHLRR